MEYKKSIGGTSLGRRNRIFALIIILTFSVNIVFVNASTNNFNSNINSQGYNVTPERITWWGGDNQEGSVSAAIDKDGNMYITCFSKSFGFIGENVIVIKFDENLTLLWSEIWVTNDFARPSGIAIDSEGNITIAGTIITTNPTTVHDVFVLKYNPTGEKLWNYTKKTTTEDTANCMNLDKEDNIYVAGFTNSTSGNGFIQKYNSDGIFQWTKYYGTTTPRENVRIESIAIDSDNSIFLGGTTDNSGGNLDDILLAKLDSNGNHLWNVTVGGTANQDWGTDILLTDDSIYQSGVTESLATTPLDGIVIKYNKSGSIAWNTTINYSNDQAEALDIRTNGNVMVSGTKDMGVNGNYFTVELSAEGTNIWNSTWESGQNDIASDVIAFDHHWLYTIGVSLNTTSSDDITIITYYDPSAPPEPFTAPNGSSELAGKILAYTISSILGVFAIGVIGIIVYTYFFKKKK